jgi:cobalt/nickel transport system ATP-binding protein
MHGTGESIFKFPQILRRHALRLPRIGHLMEILNRKDQLDVDVSAATIGKARQSILRLVGKRDE